jgi:hypothetical protein
MVFSLQLQELVEKIIAVLSDQQDQGTLHFCSFQRIIFLY